MSLDSGSIPIIQYRNLNSGVTIPGSGSAPTQLTAGTPNIRSMTLTNTSTASVSLLHGPDANLKVVCIIPPATTIQRAPMPFGVGNRLSLRATDAATVTTGEIIINCWS